jgi:hypothetical protein
VISNTRMHSSEELGAYWQIPIDGDSRGESLPALSVQCQGNFCGDVPSTSSSRWPYLRGEAGASFNRRYAACACGTKPRRGPPEALLKAYQLYLHSTKAILAAMYLRRVRVVGRSAVAALWQGNSRSDVPSASSCCWP